MSNEYTPTTEEVRGDWAAYQMPTGGGDVRAEFKAAEAEFDRWLAAHDREVFVKGWNAALDNAAEVHEGVS